MTRRRQIFYSDIFNNDMVMYYKEHIVDFVYDIIFRNDKDYFLSDQQKEFLEAIQNEDRVSAKSGKGIGKTGSVSFAIIWFLCCFPNPKIICTAPTFPTLKVALWPEVAKWLNKSIVKDIFEHTERKLYLKQDTKNWFCEARTAKDQSSAQGVHEDNLLIIMDEASGVKDDIFEAYDTTLTGKNNKFVMIGNPNRTVGPFYDSFNKYRNKWVNLTFNSEISPLVKKEQIEYYAEKYGIYHDLYLVNVKGEFPSGSPDAFIRLSDIHEAVERCDQIISVGEIEIGLDVARFGDDLTVLCWRYGYKVYPLKILPKNTVPEAVQLVLDTVVEIRKTTGYTKRIKVKIDDSNAGGGVTDLLKLDREHNIDVIPINFGAKGNEIYHNEASIMWGTVKDNIRYIGLPDDSYLIEELSARRWKMSPSGKIMIEPKSEYKRDYKGSPDRADALVLCFAKKVNDEIILKDFDPLGEHIIKDRLNYSGEIKYASVFYSKDLTVSMVYTSWDNNRLYVYDEYTGKDSLVYIANNLYQHMPINKIIGNEPMFSKTGDDLSSKYRKFNIHIHENFFYNELSAIETLSNMITQRRIIISKNCAKLINQLSCWKIDKNKYSLENTYGLCYSLSYIISELKKIIENRNTFELDYKPYSDDKEHDIKNTIRKITKNNNWML